MINTTRAVKAPPSSGKGGGAAAHLHLKIHLKHIFTFFHPKRGILGMI